MSLFSSSAFVSMMMVLIMCQNLPESQARSRHNEHENGHEKGDKPWDFLVLSQFWPPTSCYVYFGKEKCAGIPKEVKGFTLHGLWPSVPGSHDPFYCNNSAHFDFNKIASLEDKLDVEWVDYEEGSKTGLWEHEWDKHGTCAETLPALRGMYNYFSNTLNLHTVVDILGALLKRGIKPSSTEMYRPQDIYNSLLAEFQSKPTVVCIYKDEKYYLSEARVCFTKDFHIRDCDETIQDCPSGNKQEVRFLPFNETHKGHSHFHFHPQFRVVH